MADSDHDKLLRDFLADHEASRRAGYTPEALHKTVGHLADRVEANERATRDHFGVIERRLDAHDFRLASLEQARTKLEEDVEKVVETTGKHDLNALQHELKKRDETKKHWTKLGFEILKHAVIVALALLAGCFGHKLSGHD